MRRLAASALALAAAAALAGCGGGGRLSDSELRAQAGGICAKERKATTSVPTPTAPREIVRFLRGGTSLIGPRLRQLADLEPPKDLEPVYRNAVDLAMRQQRFALAALRSAEHGGDPVIALQTLARQTAPLARQEDTAWRVLRIPQCVGR